jgi:hypothetical protein
LETGNERSNGSSVLPRFPVGARTGFGIRSLSDT